MNIDQNVSMQIYEKKAPTDESIRILQEMQSKVINSVIFSEIIENNTIKIKTVLLEPIFADPDFCLYIAFFLNGNEYEIKTKIKRKEILEINNFNEVEFKILTCISESITDCLIRNNFEIQKTIAKAFKAVKEN